MTRVGRRQRGGGCGAGRFVPTGELLWTVTVRAPAGPANMTPAAGVTVNDTNMCKALFDGADRQDGM